MATDALFLEEDGGLLPPGATKRERQELEFLPAMLEIVETPASPTRRLTALVICSLLTGALIWSCLARIDMVAVASGRVVPIGEVKVVQPLTTASIRAIRVEDGDHVKAGQVLVELDPTEADADIATLTYDRGKALLDAEIARLLLGEDVSATLVPLEGVTPDLAAAGQARAVDEITRQRSALAEIDADIAEKVALASASDVALTKAQDEMPILEERFNVAQDLYSKKVGPRPPMLDAKQQLIERRAEIATDTEGRKQIDAERHSLEAKRQETETSYIADAMDRRAKALQTAAELTQQLAKAELQHSLRDLTAPVDGTVQNLKVHTAGAVVTAADTLMTIVPDADGIEIEASVANMDIGFVHEGQPAEIKLEAFPFTHYGLLHGTVRQLGRNSDQTIEPGPSGTASSGGITPSTQPAGTIGLTYPAKIRLGQSWIEVDGEQQSLRPGMQATVEIKTGTRRVIEYLTSTIRRDVQESARER